MGNQARVKDNATVVSTSTRNFPNRLGDDADVYLSSAEVAAIAAKLGRIPTVEEYLSAMQGIEPTSNERVLDCPYTANNRVFLYAE
jgi:aconitate hydratase 2/2-methylisocitrate dehydratase